MWLRKAAHLRDRKRHEETRRLRLSGVETRVGVEWQCFTR